MTFINQHKIKGQNNKEIAKDNPFPVVTEETYLRDIVVELRIISFLLNEGLNQKESLETLRNDELKEI